MNTDQQHCDAAWWSAVAEPGDKAARIIRLTLGDAESRRWLTAPTYTRPMEMGEKENDEWKRAWCQWRERALGVKVEADLERISRAGGQFIMPGDSHWPTQLAILAEEEPMGLWMLGAPHILNAPAISIVGARASTSYGEKLAYTLSYDLAAQGYVITSGGAIGIDIAAHRGALGAQCPTIAILAGGVCNPYPTSHAGEFHAICDRGGAIISEMNPIARPARWRFLTRNRLIAAWGRASVIVEAGPRSGALATARRALELGRPLGAVPGRIDDPMSVGCLELARNGATIVRDCADVVELAGAITATQTTPLFGSPVEQDQGIDTLAPTWKRVYESLPTRGAWQLKRIAQASGLATADIMTALTELEIIGLVDATLDGWARSKKGRR